jgi:hypothetical protein
MGVSLLLIVCYDDACDNTGDDKDNDEADEEAYPSLLACCARGIHCLFGVLDTV